MGDIFGGFDIMFGNSAEEDDYSEDSEEEDYEE